MNWNKTLTMTGEHLTFKQVNEIWNILQTAEERLLKKNVLFYTLDGTGFVLSISKCDGGLFEDTKYAYCLTNKKDNYFKLDGWIKDAKIEDFYNA